MGIWMFLPAVQTVVCTMQDHRMSDRQRIARISQKLFKLVAFPKYIKYYGNHQTHIQTMP